MAKTKGILLSESERSVLLKETRDGKTFSYRQRCQIILLKAENRISKDVSK